MDLEEIHKRGLLHRAIHILVINSKGEIFVRRRSWQKKLYPGVFSTSVGVHVLKGQRSKECARVNMKKFLGLELPLEKLGEAKVKDEVENEYITVYLCKSDFVKELNPEESAEGEFMTVERIKGLVKSGQITPHLAKAIVFLENKPGKKIRLGLLKGKASFKTKRGFKMTEEEFVKL